MDGRRVHRSFPGDDDADVRDALSAPRRDAGVPLSQVALDGALVAQVRGILTREPLAEVSSTSASCAARWCSGYPCGRWRTSRGRRGGRVFVLRDGKPLNTGVPGIFTWDGLPQRFLPLVPQVTKDASEDGWVLGRRRRQRAASVKDTNQLRRDMLGLYLDDYTRRWDALLANVALKPFGNLQQA